MNLQIIQSKIYNIRGIQVMLDFDLAELYQVETRILNQAVKRNAKRFPADFMFQLTAIEWENLKSQIVISSWGGTRKLPHAFTESGLAMLSGLLNSNIAIDVNINIMRAFVTMRQYLITNAPTKELEELSKQVKYLQEDIESLNKDHEGYEKQFDEIYLAIAELSIKNKNNTPRKRIGFIKDGE